MTKYKVIESFRGKDEGLKTFLVGDEYSSENKDRIQELLSPNNAFGKPLIEKVKKVKDGNDKNDMETDGGVG